MVVILYIMLACLPLSVGGWSIELVGVTFHLYTFLLMATLPVAMLSVVFGVSNYRFTQLDWLIFALAMVFLVSTFVGGSDTAGWRITFHALFVPIASYFVCKVFVTNLARFGRALFALMVGIAALSVATILEFVRTGTRPFVFEMPPIGVATILVFGLLYSLFKEKEGKLTLRTGLLVLVAPAFVLTFSRVYLLFVLVSPIILRFLRKRLMLVWLAFFVVSMLATLTVTYGIDFSSVRVSEPANHNTSERLASSEAFVRAVVGRAYVYRESLEGLPSHILFGEGISVGEYQVTPHNFNVEWLQYGGVLGYLTYLSVFLLHVRRVSRVIEEDKNILALNLALLAVIVNGLTNGFMHGVMPYVGFIIIGLSEAKLAIHGRVKIAYSRSNSLVSPQKLVP